MTDRGGIVTAGTHRRELLTIEGVDKMYPGRGGSPSVEVLRAVDLTVAPGELVAIAGRSGSGKTTLLQIAAGILAPTTGAVWWGETPLQSLGDDARARRRGVLIGIVFQNAALIESLTAEENVLVAALPTDAKRLGPRAAELLAAQGLGDRVGHYPSNLSGGERQRVALARALLNDPPLLLVDEPTANLDRASADAVIGTLRNLATDGHGVLVATHDPHLVRVATSAFYLEAD